MVKHTEEFLKKHAERIKRAEEERARKEIEKKERAIRTHLNELERRRKKYNSLKNNHSKEYILYLAKQAEYREKYKASKQPEQKLIDEQFSDCVKIVLSNRKKFYFISKTGDVYNHKGRLLKNYKDKNGYAIFGNKLIHRLVWEAFNGKIPDGMEIDHINAVRDDNRLENLRVVTHRENCNNPISIENYKKHNKNVDRRYLRKNFLFQSDIYY